MSLLGEIKRRKVFQVAAVYAVVAWLLVQVVVTVKAPLDLPSWADTLVIVMVAVGFPIAIVLAWAFDITPQGVKLTPPAAAPAVELAPAGAAASESHSVAQRTPARDPRSLAVLPFVNMSSDAEQEYFSDGLSEELLNVLAHVDELRVAGRTSSFSFKGRNEDLRVIGERLGVANVLEGSVRKAGDRLRITAQLVSATDGYHLWSETFDRKLDDVFAIQDEIAHAVADALSVTLGVREASAAAGLTDNTEVYDLYLRARALQHDFQPESLLRARQLYQQIIASDPGFTRARAGLAEVYYYMLIYIPERNAETARDLEAVVADAHAHAPDEWTTFYASAILHHQRHEWLAAERDYARAAKTAPPSDLGMSVLHAWMLREVGRVAESVDVAQATMRLDPLSISVSYLLQDLLHLAGRAEEAEAEYQRSLDLPGQREAQEHLAFIRVWNDEDRELVRARFDRYLSYSVLPIPEFVALRDVFEDREPSLEILRAAVEDPRNQDSTRQQLFAMYLAHFHDDESALAAVRRAALEMHHWSLFVLWAPQLAAMRRLPSFKALVRDMGLVDYWRATENWGEFCQPLGAEDFECS